MDKFLNGAKRKTCDETNETMSADVNDDSPPKSKTRKDDDAYLSLGFTANVERRILEEAVTPLNLNGLLNQQPGQTATTLSAPENNDAGGRSVPLLHHGQKTSAGNEDQHVSKLHFFQDSSCDGEPSKKQELWKTASLDRNPQLNQAQIVKRSGSHDAVTSKQQSSPSTPQPPSPSRCVSGKRLCSGCSQPLGKGAAMIIDTLGLCFHIQCFKCGVCDGQLGDATAGTDVRIRNGLLSCHECYIASRVLPADVQQLLVIKEEVLHEWSHSLDQQDPELLHIKEEQEELCKSQEGEQIHGLHEDIARFPLTAVPVKTEDDEDKAQSSQLNVQHTEENSEAEPSSNSSAKRMRTETDGEDCGRPEPARNPDQNSHVQPNTDRKASDSSETEVSNDDCDEWQKPLSDSGSETEDSDNGWKKSRAAESGGKSDVGYNTAKKTFSCSDCGKLFHYKWSLQRHLTDHSGKSSSSLLANKKRFRVRRNVESQMTADSKEKLFGCDECDKRFRRKACLKEHMKVHTEKPYSCEICGHRFSLNSNLKQHMTVHTRQKPYSCEVCGQRFSLNSSLLRHMSVHAGQKPYSCEVCGQRFSRKSNLPRHMVVHTGQKPYSCEVCGKRFSVKSNLPQHMRVHTGQKPYSCEVCGQRFTQNSSLKQHMRVHTGEKPYSCEVCGKKFRVNSTLRRHMSVHTE